MWPLGKGLAHEHGAQDMVKEILKVGYKEVVLKCDGETALRSVQEEAICWREAHDASE